MFKQYSLYIGLIVGFIGFISNFSSFVEFFTGKRKASELNSKDIICIITIIVAFLFVVRALYPEPEPNPIQYEMEVYVTQEPYEPYRRNFRDYSVQGTNEVYSTRDTYGEKHITFTVTEEQLAQAAVYSPGATIPEDNSGMFVGGINKSNEDAYVMQIPLYDGRYYPLFIKTKIG